MAWGIFYFLTCFLFFVAVVLFTTFHALRHTILLRKTKLRKPHETIVHVGIFHPYCNAGGGGERVLWCAIRALQAKYDNLKIVIYTGDVDCSPSKILGNVRTVFNVNIDEDNVSFIYLKYRHWVEAKAYPYFTLLGQSLGSLVLGLEALYKFPPDVYLDTMGYAFTLPLFRFIGNCKVGCYVHYPTISTDMLRRVQTRTHAVNNPAYVARNPFLTWVKLSYYRILSRIYRWAGRCAQTIMVNSSWTENHILELWEAPFKTHRVYPPCDVRHLKELPRNDEQSDDIIIMSISQFRPEKDHPLQLKALYELRTLLVNNEDIWNRVRLHIIGSCRNEDDYVRLKNMQDLSKHLSLEDAVEFKVNVPYDELLKCYQNALIGVHTMWNEHFGIGVVESMAAGLIMVAHRSGGPLLDIVETSEGSQNGYLAVDAIEYARCFLHIMFNSKEQNDKIRKAARASTDRFSEKEFETNFLRAVTLLFHKAPET